MCCVLKAMVETDCGGMVLASVNTLITCRERCVVMVEV